MIIKYMPSFHRTLSYKNIIHRILVLDIKEPSYNYTFFKFMHGAITLNDIEEACYIQIFWFGFPYLYATYSSKVF